MDTPDELLRRATTGDAHACLHMGKRLMRGRSSTARNFEEAVEWFDRAARAGLPDARYWLGKCYLKGLGCLRDPAGGVSCLEQAAHAGHAAAALRLGLCFETGLGAPKSAELAAWWYRKAQALGEPRATEQLLRLAKG